MALSSTLKSQSGSTDKILPVVCQKKFGDRNNGQSELAITHTDLKVSNNFTQTSGRETVLNTVKQLTLRNI